MLLLYIQLVFFLHANKHPVNDTTSYVHLVVSLKSRWSGGLLTCKLLFSGLMSSGLISSGLMSSGLMSIGPVGMSYHLVKWPPVHYC